MAGNDEPKTIVTDSDFHAVLVFPKEGVAKLLEHLRASERHGAAWDHLTDPAFLRPGETMPDHGWADGGQIDNARIPPHLKLVKDDGIYLMSSGLPPLMADGSIGDEGQLGRRFVVYAEGYDPASNPNCWDDSRDAVGGDDFSTLLEPEWAEHALARGEDLQIGATPDHFALLDAPGEGSKYSIGRDGTGGRSTEPRDVVAGDPRSIAEAMQLFLPEGVKAQAAKNGISFSQDNALLPVSIAFLDEAYALKRLGKPEFRIGHGEEVKLIDRTVKAAAEAVGFDPARYSTGQKRSGHRGGPDSAPTGPEPRPEEHRPEPYAALRSVLEERLPAGVSAHFVPAEDPSVDDAFTFRKDGKDLPYGVQIGEGSLALHRDHVNGKGDLVSITDLGMFEPGEERRLAARLGVALAQHLKVPQEIQTPPVKPASVPATERTTGKTTAKQAAKRNRKSRGVEM